MPLIDDKSPSLVPPTEQGSWKVLHRIEDTGGDTSVVAQALQTYPFERLLYAEGDSWFDKFTPLPKSGTNLLSAIRLPAFAGVVDVSHIGDLSREMVSGWQRQQTRAMFNLFDFDAILLSAGGNDLKNVFASLFHEMADHRRRPEMARMAPQLEALERGTVDNAPFDRVMEDIRAFTPCAMAPVANVHAARHCFCMAMTTCSRATRRQSCLPARASAPGHGSTLLCTTPDLALQLCSRQRGA